VAVEASSVRHGEAEPKRGMEVGNDGRAYGAFYRARGS
jgi:hypothetical protein